jgi:hypothetical protein
MVNRFGRFRRKHSWPSQCTIHICLQGLRKNTKNFRQDSQSPVEIQTDPDTSPEHYSQTNIFLTQQIKLYNEAMATAISETEGHDISDKKN